MVLQSDSGPCLSSDRRLSARLVSTFVDRGYHVVSAANINKTLIIYSQIYVKVHTNIKNREETAIME
jgi:hypothetical protein